ncbi:hypothetical protein BGZ60DRAFT_481059 [Tricladium varicosporioides]|nr:hypothetical protein BGZ60DRAFT_481059 [Hymenoscyphus varicosporioides]
MGGEEPFSGNVGNWTVGETIESLSRNLTVNAFYIAPFMQQIPQNVTLRITSSVNVFAYNARNLLLAYGIALLATLFALTLGLRAIFLNGVSHNSSFSGMLCTTRNPTLDALAKGRTLGAEPLERDIGKTRLRFGELRGKRIEKGWVRGRVVGRLGFGVEGEVGELRRGGVYC